MNLIQALLLGIVQGMTEFFPVSSSAHLKFARYLLGLGDGEQWIFFDLACHAGTWFALVWHLRREVATILLSPRKIGLFALALTPLIPAYFLLKPLRIALSSPAYTGWFLLATSLLLFLALRKRPVAASGSLKSSSVLSVGVMQAFALLPGLSRSGATIAMGRFCGWSWKEAALFSFLLAVPTIGGGEMLETWKWIQGSSDALPAIPLSCYAVGALASFGVGLFSVRAVLTLYERERAAPFAWYCALFGLLLIAVFHG